MPDSVEADPGATVAITDGEAGPDGDGGDDGDEWDGGEEDGADPRAQPHPQTDAGEGGSLSDQDAPPNPPETEAGAPGVEQEAAIIELEAGVVPMPRPPPSPIHLPSWERVGGSARRVAVAANGDVWSIGVVPEPTAEGRFGLGFTLAKRVGDEWLRVESPGAIGVALEPTGIPWIIGNNGQLSRGSDSTRNPTWTAMPSPCAIDLAIAASGDRWLIDCENHEVLKWQAGIWRGGPAPLWAQRVAVAPSGIPWIVDRVDRVFERLSADGAENGWRYRIGTGARDVTAAPDGRLFILGDIFKRDGFLAKYLSRNDAWIPLDEAVGGAQIAAGPGYVWLVDTFAQIYRLDTSTLE